MGFKKSSKYESHFGRLEIDGVYVEIMWDLRVFRNGHWSQTLKPAMRKLETVLFENRKIPVVSLSPRKTQAISKKDFRMKSPDMKARVEIDDYSRP